MACLGQTDKASQFATECKPGNDGKLATLGTAATTLL
jgi:hypothetical protein